MHTGAMEMSCTTSVLLTFRQSPNTMEFLRMVMIITVVTENTGLVLIGTLLSLTAGVPHSRFSQRWKVHRPWNLSLPYELHHLRERVHSCGSKTLYIQRRVQWDTSSEGL